MNPVFDLIEALFASNELSPESYEKLLRATTDFGNDQWNEGYDEACADADLYDDSEC